MTRPGPAAARSDGPDAGRSDGGQRGGHNEGWSVFGYLISGMAFYGGIGWIAGRLAHLSFLFPVGMLTGLILGIVLILYRYGKA
jgi:F0F1-type ATP synthase assembly protein I